jgi:hypothetical protein
MWTTAANSQQLPVNSKQLPVESNYRNSSPNLKPNSSQIPPWQETQVNAAQKSQSQDQINIESSPVMDSNLLVTDNWSLVTDLPCLDSSAECIDLLTEKAIAFSAELKTLSERIGLLDKRLGLADNSIDYAESKLWTNYIPDSFSPNPLNIINPFSWIKNIFGGGDIQREKIAIADLELKKANVEVQRAELERHYAEVESQTREEILTLVLEYEEALRQTALITAQLNNHQIITKVMEIDYRFGGSSTESYLAAVEKQERLSTQIIELRIAQTESLRKILFITGFEPPIPNPNLDYPR